MMMPSSFLHAASAKALTNNNPTHHTHQQSITSNAAGALRLLLVEEDSSIHHPTNANGINGSPPSTTAIMHRHRHRHPILAYSLIMDAACAIVASSTLSCRGCDIKMKSDNDDETTRSNNDKQCRCCKAVLLIPGSTKHSRKRRRNEMKYRNDNDYINSQQRQLAASLAADKIPFPIQCNPLSNNNNNNTTNENNKEEWAKP